MSLLAAILDWRNPAPPVQDLGHLLSALPERASDGRHFIRLRHALLGYAALNVLRNDGVPGHLLADDRRKLWILGDVRLDNRDELRASLSLFESLTSDLALVLAAYERWGAEAAQQLVGDFAFVIWDGRKREVYAARDPFGVRSLVYHRATGKLILATDPAQLLALREIDRSPNPQTVVDFLSWSFAHYGSTFFRGVDAILPGHYLRANQDVLVQTEYFHPPDRLIRYSRAEDYRDEFRWRFRRAVKDRLDSGYPVVAHLSGGLDSSSIVCMADRLYREAEVTSPALHVVSAVFPGHPYDETPFIEEVMRAVTFEGHRWNGNVPSGMDFLSPSLSIPGATAGFNGGSAGDVEIARRLGARVILSGDPGDAVTGESGLFNELIAGGSWLTLARQVLGGGSARERRLRFTLLKFAAREEVPGVVLSTWRAMNRWRRPSTIPTWFREELKELWAGPEHRRAPRLGIGVNRLQQGIWDHLRWARTAWGIDLFGVYAASAGIEVRFPLLDARLVRFILAVPPEHRLLGELRRELHRESMAGIVPDSIRRRASKPSFNGAVVQWGHASAPAILEILEERSWQSEPFVDQDKARRLFRHLCSRPPHHADRPGWLAIRSIVHLETWLRAVLRYPRDQEILSMSEIQGPGEEGEADSGGTSHGSYVPPRLAQVGNVRELLAEGPISGDDSTPPTPGLPA